MRLDILRDFLILPTSLRRELGGGSSLFPGAKAIVQPSLACPRVLQGPNRTSRKEKEKVRGRDPGRGHIMI